MHALPYETAQEGLREHSVRSQMRLAGSADQCGCECPYSRPGARAMKPKHGRHRQNRKGNVESTLTTQGTPSKLIVCSIQLFLGIPGFASGSLKMSKLTDTQALYKML